MEGNHRKLGPPPLTLSDAEAAEYVGATRGQLASWRSSGCGPRYIKLPPGGRTARVRYRVAELERWLAERERTSTADPGRTTSHSAMAAGGGAT